ncbi:hypothetical protein PR048_006426 [Dryococelus australis]|uniref:Uncharacterized protein n=1 Tax=Dryococelus australis TaxID=614101 RepID=A0ABQ9IAY2_9NEOP|nr:hypothetical protein PR048_006426 [Dryococelus australis]
MDNWLKTGRIKGADCKTSNSANKAGCSADERAINENILPAVMEEDPLSDEQEIKRNTTIRKFRKSGNTMNHRPYLSFGFIPVGSLKVSTDVAGLAVLIVIVRYVFEESIEEDLFLCTPLNANATGEKCLKLLIVTYSNTTSIGTSCKNYQLYQLRLFKKACEEMGSQHQSILIRTVVGWFSRGKVLAKLFELHNELRVFLMGEDPSVPGKFAEFSRNEKWLMRCAYFANIFGKLNYVSLSLQGKATTVFTLKDKMASMCK